MPIARFTTAGRQKAAERAARLYRKGSSIRDIAETLECSYGLARTLVVEAGVDLRARGGYKRPVRA